MIHNCRATVSLCRQLEAAGCSLLTVHARTAPQRSSAPSHPSLVGDVVAGVGVRVLANGDCRWGVFFVRKFFAV